MIKNKIEIREIQYKTDEYRSEVALRDEVLRKPLGMSLYDENLEAEEYDFHVGAFLNNSLVGVMILTRLNNDDVKMRQVAVDEQFRGQRVGTQMVYYAENYAKSMGYRNLLLNARNTAVAFYEKLGYEKFGESFLEVNIPHYKMRKVFK